MCEQRAGLKAVARVRLVVRLGLRGAGAQGLRLGLRLGLKLAPSHPPMPYACTPSLMASCWIFFLILQQAITCHEL